MPDYDPPAGFVGHPHRFLLPPDTALWHIHPRTRKPTEFTSGASRFGGDYHGGPQAGPTVLDTLLGGLPTGTGTARTLRRAAVIGQRISVLATATELALVSLCDAADLRAVGQDRWLIHSADVRDPRLRRWAEAVRGWAPDTVGFLWPPAGCVQQRVLVLFGDRCDPSVLAPTPLFGADLDDEFGARWLNSVLVEYRLRINPPGRRG